MTNNNSGSGNNPPPAGTIPRPRRLTDVRKVTSKEKQALRKQGIAQKISEVM